MLPLIIHAVYEGSDHCRKNQITRKRGLCIFFLQFRNLNIPNGSPKKTFYCLDKFNTRFKSHLMLHLKVSHLNIFLLINK